jgi:hypothetical protein
MDYISNGYYQVNILAIPYLVHLIKDINNVIVRTDVADFRISVILP